MISAAAQVWIWRKVARVAVDEARTASQEARATPDEERIIAALRACVRARRSLLRASEHCPDDEDEMIEEAFLWAEAVEDLKRRLAHVYRKDRDSNGPDHDDGASETSGRTD